MRIGIVGDLSQEDPAGLAKALDAALPAADVVVQVGDVNPGYDVIRARLGGSWGGKLLVVPGNHDTQGPGSWDAHFPDLPKQWRRDYPDATLVGLDNSCDALGPGWDLLAAYAAAPRPVPLFLFAHKSLSTIVLPDGSESTHVMGEGSPSPEAERLKAWMRGQKGATIAVGHYHGSSFYVADYGHVIVEGRGGAGRADGAKGVGYTLVVTRPEGLVAHSIEVP